MTVNNPSRGYYYYYIELKTHADLWKQNITEIPPCTISRYVAVRTENLERCWKTWKRCWKTWKRCWKTWKTMLENLETMLENLETTTTLNKQEVFIHQSVLRRKENSGAVTITSNVFGNSQARRTSSQEGRKKGKKRRTTVVTTNAVQETNESCQQDSRGVYSQGRRRTVSYYYCHYQQTIVVRSLRHRGHAPLSPLSVHVATVSHRRTWLARCSVGHGLQCV